MTREEFRALVESIDKKNAEYIVDNYRFVDAVEQITRFEKKESGCERVVADLIEALKKDISEFDSRFLSPANVKVGDGATVNLWTDRHAGTIVKVTKRSITIRRDKATRSPDFKPEFIIGGFSAHCTNNYDQSWTYEPDEKGELTTLYWSQKYCQYGRPDKLTASKGRHEFYDYNF